MLYPLLSLLLTNSLHRTVVRTRRNGIFLAIAALLLLTAYIFAMVAAAVWLTPLYGAAGAALFIAAAALLLGLIVLVIMAIVDAQEARKARERRLALETAATAGLGLVRSQPMLTAAVVMALLASSFTGSKKES